MSHHGRATLERWEKNDSPDSSVSFTNTFDAFYGGVLFTTAQKIALEDRGYKHYTFSTRPCQNITIPEHVVTWSKRSGVKKDGTTSFETIVEQEDFVGHVTYNNQSVTATAWGASMEDAVVGLNLILTGLVPLADVEEEVVPVTFWSLAPNGPTSISRNLWTPTWEDIGLNYGGVTREALNQLMQNDYRPSKSGQLLLWHGEPGTGKTTALRAFARETKGWLKMHYITDPETFFGDNAHYMMQVLMNEDDWESGDDDEKWRLFILEDTGELIQADAKRKTGQGLSRLLNAVDGLIGQGLRFMVLITTNEEVGKLHSAVSRPGRCAANIRFDSLTEPEIREWAEANGVDPEGLGMQATVAELYNQFHHQITTDKKVKVGFA